MDVEYLVDVNYNDRVFDTVHVVSGDRDDVEFIAMNKVRDMNPNAHNVEVLQVRNAS
jgi:hypothetical protein